jgi:hypothetical protein
MANIDPFVLGLNLYDLDRLTHNLLTKMVNDHVGEDNFVSHRELCHYYFDPYHIGLEEELLISNVLQRNRGILQDRGWFLDYRKGSGWFIVKTPTEAFEHLRRYTKREVKLHGRLQVKAFIAIGNRYQLSAGGPLIQAIQGMTPAIEQLEQAIEEAEPPAPPQPEEERDQPSE